jgi:hypothetical protein
MPMMARYVLLFIALNLRGKIKPKDLLSRARSIFNANGNVKKNCAGRDLSLEMSSIRRNLAVIRGG